MSNKALYGLLGVLGLTGVGIFAFSNFNDDNENDNNTDNNAEESTTQTQEGGSTGHDHPSSTKEDRDVESTLHQLQTSLDENNIDLSEIFQVQFEDPNNAIPKRERKSKLLKNDSALYSVLRAYRNKLESNYGDLVSNQRMDFHTELIKRNDDVTEEKLVDRAQQLEGRCIDLADTDSWNIGRHSVSINTGRVDGYGNTHITVAYFKQGVPDDVEDVLFEVDDDEEEDDVTDNGEEEEDDDDDEEEEQEVVEL